MSRNKCKKTNDDEEEGDEEVSGVSLQVLKKKSLKKEFNPR